MGTRRSITNTLWPKRLKSEGYAVKGKNASHFFCGKEIGYYFLDFLVEDTVVLELKPGNSFSNKNID